MALQFSTVTRQGPITIVTLSRPEVYNALHTDAHNELHEVFNEFSADPEQWVAVVTGAGDKAFCAGNDLKWQAAGGKRGRTRKFCITKKGNADGAAILDGDPQGPDHHRHAVAAGSVQRAAHRRA